MRRLVVALLLCASTASAQGIIARDGWEAFPMVEYWGGDATQPKKLTGMLVLTDSAIALHRCVGQACYDRKGKLPYQEKPFFSIPLTAITRINGSAQVRGSDAAGKLLLGALAPDRPDGLLGLVYETATTAEAPMFKAKKELAGAIEAKLRFRLKRLGIELPPE